MIGLGAVGSAAKTAASLMSPRAWKILGIVLGIAAVIGLFLWALDSYGDREFAAGHAQGKTDERNAWIKAEQEYQKREELARTEADQKAATREAEHIAQVEKEREEINEAVAEGRSPLDVLFPSIL